MSHIEEAVNVVSVDELASYDDEELRNYLERNGNIVFANGSDHISKNLIRKIKNVIRSKNASSTPGLSNSTGRNLTPHWFNTEKDFQRILTYDKRSHQELIRLGGRPLYDIKLHELVMRDMETYQPMLNPWLNQFGNTYTQGVFVNQKRDWEHFLIIQDATRRGRVRQLSHFWQAFINCGTFEMVQRDGWFDGSFPVGFKEYCDHVNDILAKYGYLTPFELELDQKLQNRLGTWAEYCAYELVVWENELVRVLKARGKYQEAWAEVVAANVLLPHETQRVVDYRDRSWGSSLYREQHSGVQAVDYWRSRLREAQEISPPDLSAITAIESTLQEAVNRQKQAFKRQETFDKYWKKANPLMETMNDVYNSRKKASWALDQLRFIEDEHTLPANKSFKWMRPQSEATVGADENRRRRRSSFEDEEMTQLPPPKRRAGSAGPSTQLGNRGDGIGIQTHLESLQPGSDAAQPTDLPTTLETDAGETPAEPERPLGMEPQNQMATRRSERLAGKPKRSYAEMGSRPVHTSKPSVRRNAHNLDQKKTSRSRQTKATKGKEKAKNE